MRIFHGQGNHPRVVYLYIHEQYQTPSASSVQHSYVCPCEVIPLSRQNHYQVITTTPSFFLLNVIGAYDPHHPLQTIFDYSTPMFPVELDEEKLKPDIYTVEWARLALQELVGTVDQREVQELEVRARLKPDQKGLGRDVSGIWGSHYRHFRIRNGNECMCVLRRSQDSWNPEPAKDIFRAVFCKPQKNVITLRRPCWQFSPGLYSHTRLPHRSESSLIHSSSPIKSELGPSRNPSMPQPSQELIRVHIG